MKLIDLSAVCFPAMEKEVARTYLQNRKISDEQIKKVWFVEDAASLEMLVNPQRVTKYDSPDVTKELRPFDHDVSEHGVPISGQRLVFPLERNGEVVGLVCRHIDDSPEQFRYMNLRCSGTEPLVYNYDGVNRNEQILVTEGILDGMHLPNNIALLGSDYKKVEEFKDNSIIVYDNEPYKQNIYYKNKGAIESGFAVCIWDNRIGGLKDINEMVMAGMSIDRIVDIIKSCAVKGQEALDKLSEYSKHE